MRCQTRLREDSTKTVMFQIGAAEGFRQWRDMLQDPTT